MTFDEYEFGFTWVLDELMERASHALVSDGRVWLIDPVDEPEALAKAAALGEPAGVIQLLDRHNRDCAAIAGRLGVPHHRLPDALDGTPFQVVKVIDLPGWRELALWWPEHRALVVSEAVGTGAMFRAGDRDAGVHVMLRLRPPSAPRRFAPDHLLCGHGAPVHGAAASPALRQAYARSLRDLPAVLAKLPRLAR